MEWSIGEVARRAGLRASALRYYEAEGLLPRAERRNGRRVYQPVVLEHLAVIELAQHAGFTIAEIKRLMHGFRRNTPPSVRWRSLATRKLDEVREGIERMRRMEQVLETLLGCECPSLEACGAAMDADGRPSC